MLSRITAGIVITVLAWTASCFGGEVTKNTGVSGLSLPSPTTVLSVLSKEETIQTTTTSIQVPAITVLTTTSTTTTTLSIGTHKEGIDTELNEMYEEMVEQVLETEYTFYSRGPDIEILQEVLGMEEEEIDGIYGPATRGAHLESLGGPLAAIRLWYPSDWGEELHEYYPHYLNEEEDPYWRGTGCEGRLPDPYTCDHLPTLDDLIRTYFLPEDRAWAFRVVFCESSGQPDDVFNEAVSSALAVGWFQHLKKYWDTGYRKGRAWDAGFGGYSIFDPIANVGVAAHLFYTSGAHHWNPSKHCWRNTPHG